MPTCARSARRAGRLMVWTVLVQQQVGGEEEEEVGGGEGGGDGVFVGR